MSIETKGITLEEKPMPAIPFPAINWEDDLLPERFGKNAVSVFKSRTGKKEEGMLVVNYYDGLGRSEETVQQGMSPNHKDLVILQEYDGLGRKSNTWLPAVTTHDTGDFISTDTCRELACNTYKGDLYPYLSLIYENSPLEKVIRQHNPGRVWREYGRSLKTDEYVNIAGNDTLDCFSFQLINGVRDVLNVTASRQYEDGSLLITRSEDEDGVTLFEFKDRLGRTVLKRCIESKVKEVKQFSDTYYIYDDLGKLCAVLPPALSDRLSIGRVSVENLDMYAYLYKYDVAGNLMAKKRPGVSWEYYVYNANNYLIFSQDGEERKRGEWKFSIPDVFGRVCLQGVCKIVIDPFDNPYLKTRFNTLSNWYVCEYVGAAEYGGYQFSGNLGAKLMGPKPLVQVINYYDNYDFMHLRNLWTKDEFMYASRDGFAATASNAKGMLTGTSKLLSDSYDRYCNDETDIDSQYNCSVMYYDNRGRLSQSVSDNHLGGLDHDFFSYDFNGNLLRHLHRQNGADNDTLSDCYTYEYDHVERLVKVMHHWGDSPAVTLINNMYDDLGRLSRKAFHNGLLDTSYTYNIRSWLTGITSTSFEQTLHYTGGLGTPCYNGSISSMTWKSGYEDVKRGYHFTYDDLSRLINAEYGEGDFLAQNLNRFNEQVTGYDKMSNVLGIKRSGYVSAMGYGLIDDLMMAYSGNQLKSVSDRVGGTVYGNGFDFKNGTSKDR
ncbi:DUF6443 domain-containing protein, partial [Bacteroides reticulotermitis]|uniref:DUF6443 domain-containing protein n=1 Tax=Bacteroides reticulotermitis TaxID=1133319 RepID=UPI001FCBE3CD